MKRWRKLLLFVGLPGGLIVSFFSWSSNGFFGGTEICTTGGRMKSTSRTFWIPSSKIKDTELSQFYDDYKGSDSHRHTVRNDPGKEYQFLVKGDGEWVEREDVWIYLDQAPRDSPYGGLDASYETNLAAFIKDIRSAEHGLGVADLPVVIATSGIIETESLIKQGQLAMGDTKKYPAFTGNVAVVDTDKPYGPDKMGFKFYTDKSPDKVGYHWNYHARSYINIGRAMAAEMSKLNKPVLPSHLVVQCSDQGVRLNWQLGSEKPGTIEILRNGKSLGVALPPTQTAYVDSAALPGANSYELLFDLPSSGQRKLSGSGDTSVTGLSAYRGMEGVMLGWEARGKSPPPRHT